MPRRVPPAAEVDRALHVREGRALGSPLRLVAFSRPGIDAAWAAIRAEFAAVDAAMSRFREDSEVTRLNRSGRASSISRRLRASLVLADRARRLTGGRFDPRILRDLERLGFEAADIGDGRARAHDGDRGLDRVVRRCEDGGVEVPRPIDLGGIGKGLALRWAADAAARFLDGPFLIDAGGDLTTRAAPPGGWSIGIEDPLGNGPIATCALGDDQAIATSSIRNGRRPGSDGPVHRIIDPMTGRSGGAGVAAVTVVWPDPAWAEVWSKSLFLAGAAGIAAEARARGLAAWWVDDRGAIAMTPAARLATTWVRDEAVEVRPAPPLAERTGEALQPSRSWTGAPTSHSRPGHGSIGSRPFEPRTRLTSPRW